MVEDLPQPRARYWRDKIEGPCDHCHERPATMIWCEGGFMAVNHGASFEWWCDVCALEAQIAAARERAAAIPDLERQLAEARAAFLVASPEEP